MNNRTNFLLVLNIIIFIFWPLGGFVLSLFHIRSKAGAFFFLLYFFLLGCSIDLTNQAPDSYRYAYDFIEMGHLGYSNILYKYINGQILTLYIPIIDSFIFTFTHNPKFLLGIFGLIFGLFFYKSLRLFIDQRKGRVDIFALIAIISFSFINSYVNISGVRFWTATFVFFYAVAKYSETKTKKLLLFFLLTIAIHFAFILPVLLWLLAYVLKIKPKFLLIVCILSFVLIPIMNVANFQGLFQSDSLYGAKYNTYVNVDLSNEIRQASSKASFLYHFMENLPILFSLFFLIILNRTFDNKDVGTHTHNLLFRFILLLIIFSNIFNGIPSLGPRFRAISMLFVVYLLYTIYTSSCKVVVFQSKIIRSYNKQRIWKFLILFLPIVSFVYIDYCFVLQYIVFTPEYYNSSLFHIINDSMNFRFR